MNSKKAAPRITGQRHGITSLILIFTACLIGLFSIAAANLTAAFFYVAVLFFAPLVIAFAYCAKCPCAQNACMHVLPGKLTKLLPARQPGPYTRVDIIGVGVPLLAMLLMPQYWLWKTPVILVVFWALLLFALFEIRTTVCKHCGNELCMLAPAECRR